MAKCGPFEKEPVRYEEWFEENRFAYESELLAVRGELPQGAGVEIGAGSARFAGPLGIKIGLEPSARMRELARKRGVLMIDGVAESLPFLDGSLDFALMVTVICFLDDVDKAFKEACRVLKPGGRLIIGFIDRESPLGRVYLERKNGSVFYRDATFYSTEEVLSRLEKAGFRRFKVIQTIFHDPRGLKAAEPAKDGYGQGLFVVINAGK
ncbi:MAG: class I SAM-dependent methyltransferase [Deltaproteobacteria bacterium]|nr:class I SAM-dependent methyltransferase [Deltaproteobacteria bacterium]